MRVIKPQIAGSQLDWFVLGIVTGSIFTASAGSSYQCTSISTTDFTVNEQLSGQWLIVAIGRQRP